MNRSKPSAVSESFGLPQALRDDVRLLGDMLGRIIGNHRGVEFVDRIETIRFLAKKARRGDSRDWNRLSDCLAALPEDALIDIARAFNQFLNLANIAEQRQEACDFEWPSNIGFKQLVRTRIELVLTAHPTEVLRRTLIRKYDVIAALLDERCRCRLEERSQLEEDLERLVAEAWHSDEIRRERPTPQDEARWGFAVVENSLWDAVPKTMRELERAVGELVPPQVMPFAFSSWMGGDRDGNPSVTAAVTREVLLIGRWVAADLFLRDVSALNSALSMTCATREMRRRVGDVQEPYRALLKELRGRLEATRRWVEQGGRAGSHPQVIKRDSELIEPLELCFASLNASGMERIARGPLLDTLRRAYCFGVHLVRLDVRQHAARHAGVLDELTRFLTGHKLGYCSWGEPERRAWLLDELASRRPLFPASWPVSEEAREVLETCAVIAEDDGAGISAYVVSMAAEPSDVLAVALLLKDAGVRRRLPIVPLFETLADLVSSATTIDKLLSLPWYRDYVGERLQVMIGYSDSAKDAGQFAAAWAQYKAQESIARVAGRHGVKLTVFHGRGGAIGRGGGPSARAIESQAPGSLEGMLRVTEQGEMIRFRLGTPAIAQTTLSHYFAATLSATRDPASIPDDEIRVKMDELAADARDGYASAVQNPRFVDFFSLFTPERELAALALGSRPARRSPARDIDSLRAIPWVFAWNQARLMLPGWLGTERALSRFKERPESFAALCRWPFFAMQMETLEMVTAKADPIIARYYSRRLAREDQQDIAEKLIDRFSRLADDLLALTDSGTLLSNSSSLRESIDVRNTYLDPLHLLQTELLARRRCGAGSPVVDHALKVTMAGIASGLRNAG